MKLLNFYDSGVSSPSPSFRIVNIEKIFQFHTGAIKEISDLKIKKKSDKRPTRCQKTDYGLHPYDKDTAI